MARLSTTVCVTFIAALVAVSAVACTKSTPSVTPTTAAPDGPPATPKLLPPIQCAADQLSVVPGDFKSRPHASSGVFIFTNTSKNQPCWMKGYPEMKLLDDSGADLPTQVQQGSSGQVPSIPVKRVLMKPAGASSFIFGYSTKPVGSEPCPTSSKVQIIPPGLSTPITVTFGMDPCGGKFAVTAIRSATKLPSA